MNYYDKLNTWCVEHAAEIPSLEECQFLDAEYKKIGWNQEYFEFMKYLTVAKGLIKNLYKDHGDNVLYEKCIDDYKTISLMFVTLKQLLPDDRKNLFPPRNLDQAKIWRRKHEKTFTFWANQQSDIITGHLANVGSESIADKFLELRAETMEYIGTGLHYKYRARFISDENIDNILSDIEIFKVYFQNKLQLILSSNEYLMDQILY